MLRHIAHRKIIRQKRAGQAGEGHGHQAKLQGRRGPRQRLPGQVLTHGARQRQHPLDQGHDSGQYECEMSEFWNHGFTVCPAFAAVALSSACWASGGM